MDSPKPGAVERNGRYDKLENIEFNAKYIKGKDVILCDDVTTTGQSLIQMKRKMLELGAKSVIGVFMARTI